MIFEFVRRDTRYSTKMNWRNLIAIKIISGMMVNTINASFQLIIAMKINDVTMFITAHVESTMPQLTRSETRPVSDVTRAMRRPTEFCE